MYLIRHDSARVCVARFPPPLMTNHHDVRIWWWWRVRNAHCSRRKHEQHRHDGERYGRPHNLDLLIALALLRVAFAFPPSGETHPGIGNDANNNRKSDHHHDYDDDGQIENRACLRRLRVEHSYDARNQKWSAGKLNVHRLPPKPAPRQRQRSVQASIVSNASQEWKNFLLRRRTGAAHRICSSPDLALLAGA